MCVCVFLCIYMNVCVCKEKTNLLDAAIAQPQDTRVRDCLTRHFVAEEVAGADDSAEINMHACVGLE